MSTNTPGFVYILTNPSFKENWIKIGKTSRAVEERVKELDSTGVPLSFEIYATMKTVKYNEVEKLVHIAIDDLTDLRIRKNREFFEVNPERILRIFHSIASTIDDAEMILYIDGQPVRPDQKEYKRVVKPRRTKSQKRNAKESESDATNSSDNVNTPLKKANATNLKTSNANAIKFYSEGISKFMLRLYGEAMRNFNQVKNLDAKMLTNFYIYRSLTIYNIYGPNEAKEEIIKAIEYDEFNAEAYYIKSHIEFEQGNSDDAFKDLDHAIILNYDVVNTLSICNHLTGKMKEQHKSIKDSKKDYSPNKEKLLRVPEDKAGPYIILSRVTEIGDRAFANCDRLTSIEIPNSVTLIGKEAFDGCKSLTSIKLPEGVTMIEMSTFSGCSSLTSIKLPEGVTMIGGGAFSGCTSLTSVEIPNSVTVIRDNAFNGCTSLTSIVLPDSVVEIRDDAFRGCTNLKKIVVNDNNPNYCSKDGVVYTKNMTKLIFALSCLKSVIIPDRVTEIRNNAFRGCTSLTSIYIPSSVTEIGIGAFDGCTSLTSIKIPNGVTEIGWNAFNGCTSLTSVEISNSVTVIGNWAFYKCTSLTSILIPNSVIKIGNTAFSGCTSLTSIVLPDSVTEIGHMAFQDCTNLTSIKIPNNVKLMEDKVFVGCTSLKEIHLKRKNPLDFSRAFEDLDKSNVTIYVPKGSIEVYKFNEYYKGFKIEEENE